MELDCFSRSRANKVVELCRDHNKISACAGVAPRGFIAMPAVRASLGFAHERREPRHNRTTPAGHAGGMPKLYRSFAALCFIAAIGTVRGEWGGYFPPNGTR